VIRSMEWHHP